MARQRAGQQAGRARVPYRGPGRTVRPALGVDVGGVIVRLAGRDEDTSFFGSRPLETPAVDGVVEALAGLTGPIFEGRVHIVSKAGPKVAANTRDWLHHHDFFARTGISAGHVHFVRERRDKAPVCERLGITHFVDDHLDVLAHLESVGHRHLFLGGTDEPAAPDVPPWATVTRDWAELARLLAAR
ncbi:hypothetical protein [Actinoplanes sp. L3-i22]|uniref:hypothetical protein n=1 Tax=Actinoplanes sp. L3-i22 TaxID=2836373 RepID=UPI001C7814E2|nr:hypothetical protein [Actinoplanes sp. L3-i22]BCY10420.1 hypothetical protein L3i22_055080 [Actinoplanes sp. L3-i22]